MLITHVVYTKHILYTDLYRFSGLWVRLKHRPNFETVMSLDNNSKAFLWSMVTRDEEIQMFELEVPRRDLVIFNRFIQAVSKLVQHFLMVTVHSDKELKILFLMNFF